MTMNRVIIFLFAAVSVVAAQAAPQAKTNPAAIRFSLVDDNDKVLRQEHGWFWIRRGEQRICVGCHTGPERAAENNVPAVLLRSTTPMDLAGVPAPDNARQAEKGSR